MKQQCFCLHICSNRKDENRFIGIKAKSYKLRKVIHSSPQGKKKNKITIKTCIVNKSTQMAFTTQRQTKKEKVLIAFVQTCSESLVLFSIAGQRSLPEGTKCYSKHNILRFNSSISLRQP